MSRIGFDDVVPLIDLFLGHWALLNAEPGGPFLSEPGFGRPELTTLGTTYHDLHVLIGVLETQAENLRSQRDGVFGLDGEDPAGVWFRLRQYKPAAKLHLGVSHYLTRTFPNLGSVEPGRYPAIAHDYLEHWGEVNAVSATPLTLGTLTYAGLQTIHANLENLQKQLAALEKPRLQTERARRDVMLGDLAEGKRSPTSIVTRLVNYRTYVQVNFVGNALVDSLPDVFPDGSASLTSFDYNLRAIGPGTLKVWFQDPLLPNAVVIALKEGTFEQTQAFTPASAPTVQVVTWTGVTVVDDIDELELRDASSRRIADGQRNVNLPEPNP